MTTKQHEKTYFNSIREHLTTELRKSSIGYLNVGMKIYYEDRTSLFKYTSPIIGNLSIGIELALKMFTANKNPGLLFTNLPLEIKTLFHSPSDIPNTFHHNPIDLELRSFGFKTVDLGQSIDIFYAFFPEHKQFLNPYFRLLSDIRNLSVHSALPTFQKYEQERIVYLMLNLIKIISSQKDFKGATYHVTKKDETFLSNFDEERTKKVKSKIDQARKKSKEITDELRSEIDGSHEGLYTDWERFITECPVCLCSAILKGNTEGRIEASGPDDYDESLEFKADSFLCEACGLSLDDVEELGAAGIDTDYDRSEDLSEWHADPSNFYVNEGPE